MSDKVNHPAHYTQQPVECIEFAQHLNFCMGNAFKYVMSSYKDPTFDAVARNEARRQAAAKRRASPHLRWIKRKKIMRIMRRLKNRR